ncbi:MAG: AraC family transcriptional regulator ligand-binding domain-containing protein [Solirubrobacteraceae bacterium]|nr:AraC family transcriptional regulator ligand-binding domain-containing protein [Solirubrobacteraceae bacterium]
METAPAWDFRRTAAAARLLVAVGTDRGLDAATCLAGTGLTVADLDAADAEVEAGQELAIGRNLVAALDDAPGLGVDAGSRYTLGTFGMAGFALLTAATGRDVLRLGVRYAPLSFAFIRPEIREDAAGARVRLLDEEIPVDVRAFFVEREITKVGRLVPTILGQMGPVHVATSFDGGRAAALRAGLPGVDLRSGAASHELVVDRVALDAALPQADPFTAKALEEQCAALLDRRRARQGVAASVRAQFLADLAAPPSMEKVAAALHIDARTLRRHLVAEGTSFRALADEVRATLATELLRTGGLTVQEVAARLGYHDAAGFSRAYRRWTGETPGSARSAA